LKYQCGLGNSAAQDSLPFLKANESTILATVIKLYPQSNSLRGVPCDKNYIASRAIYELYHGTKNWDSNPGYPLQMAYPNLRAAVESDALALVVLALMLVWRWATIPFEEVEQLDAYQMVQRGLSWPIRIFIKMEPHSIEKARTGRWRLVASVPSQVILAGRVLLGPQHRMNIDKVESTPACIGLGLTDSMIDILFEKAKVTEDPFGLISSDQSGFDWRFYWFWAKLLAELWISLTGATGLWANAIRNYARSMIMAILVTSDGLAYSLLIAAVRKSGDLDTGAGNSAHRICLNIAVRLWLRAKGFLHVDKSIFPACTMGDDCFESFSCPTTGPQLTEIFAYFGFKITDIVHGDSRNFEFCSTRFEEIDGQRYITALSWPRMLYRLISHEYNSEFVQQFCYELRHMTGRKGGITLSDLLLFLKRIDWLQESCDDPTNTSVINWRVPHFNSIIMSKAETKREVRKEAKREVKKEVEKEKRVKGKHIRKEVKAIERLPSASRGVSGPSRQQTQYFRRLFTEQDASKLAWLRCVMDPFTAIPASLPPIMAPGASTSRPRIYAISLKGFAVANANGRVNIGANADGWMPSSVAVAGSAPVPQFQYLGNSAGNAGARGFPVHYTVQAWAGNPGFANVSPNNYPASDRAVANAIPYLGFLQLPDALIDVQLNNDPTSGNAYQRYSNVALGLRCRPVAPAAGNLVMTGVILGCQQTLGDTVITNPTRANGGAATLGGSDAYEYMAGLGTGANSIPVGPGPNAGPGSNNTQVNLTEEMVGRTEWDIAEWPKQKGEHTWFTMSAIPNQSCCFSATVPKQTGATQVGDPQLAFVGAGLLAGQTIEFEARYIYAFYGGVSYQVQAGSSTPPVAPGDLQALTATAAPLMGIATHNGMPRASVSAPQALIRHEAAKGMVDARSGPDWLKSGASIVKSATGSSIGELLGEGLGVIAGMLL
jgi:hypothetical protein